MRPTDSAFRARLRKASGQLMNDLPSLMTGALLAGTFVSIMFLPHVAQESDFRLTRRAGGADDAAVTASYRYAQRYELYLQLGAHYPGAEFVVSAPLGLARPMLLLTAFAAAGPVCAADATTRILARDGGIFPTPARQVPDFFWEGGDPRGEVHRIHASTESKRFLFRVDGAAIDVIGADLFGVLLDQRCTDDF